MQIIMPTQPLLTARSAASPILSFLKRYISVKLFTLMAQCDEVFGEQNIGNCKYDIFQYKIKLNFKILKNIQASFLATGNIKKKYSPSILLLRSVFNFTWYYLLKTDLFYL